MNVLNDFATMFYGLELLEFTLPHNASICLVFYGLQLQIQN